MHASSRENMQLCAERYLDGSFLADRNDEIVVLDVGGADVNGSYNEFFPKPNFRYMGADISEGEGVDVVLEDPYRIPLDDGSVDIVLSGQMLEHCEFFWLTFQEMVRVMKPDGFLFLIAPSSGPIHRYPVDCYRFYPDAFQALAKYASCHLIESWIDERGPWRDLVGIFRKQQMSVPADAGMGSHIMPVQPFAPGPPEVEITSGSVDGKQLLQTVHEVVAPDRYLEIGVRHGASLALASCRAVGVDPVPEITHPLGPDVTVVELTSDAFFRDHAAVDAMGGPLDVVLIDGMHLFENALRDFMNVERLASPTTLVIIDDVFPNHPLQAARDRQTQVWTGDVWKLATCLAEHRRDLLLIPVDASPTGLLLIAGLDPANRILWDGYNPIVRKFSGEPYQKPPKNVLSREGAVEGNAPVVHALLTLLKEQRLAHAPRSTVLRLLANIRASLVSDDG